MTKGISMRILLAMLTVGSALAADVSSVIFYDFTHDATKGAAAAGSFNLGRAYLTVTGAASETVAYKLQFDAGQLKSYTLKDASKVLYDSDGDTLTTKSYSLSSSDAGFYLYVKSASLDWTNNLGKWTFGMQGMNMFNVQEATFGNRFLEKPLMDTHGFSASADLGVGFAREFGLVKTSLLYTNGGGYKKTENDKYKKLSVQIAAGETALNKKDGWNAGLVYSMEPISTDDSKSVMGLFGGWAGMGLRAGLEFDTKTTTGATDLTEQIIGVYGDYKLPFAPGFAVYGSLDMFDPNTDDVADNASTTSVDESKNNETAIIAGAKWAPVKGLIIAPNLKMISYEDSDKDALTYYRINLEFKI